MSADIIWLDRTLERYGPETQPQRELLRSEVVNIMDRLWPQQMSEMAQLTPTGRLSGAVYDSIESLSPKEDRQRLLRSEALVLATQIGQARWLMYEQGTTMVSIPLVVVVVFWLTFIFLSWGLFAPVNGTVIATFFIAAFLFRPHFSWSRRCICLTQESFASPAFLARRSVAAWPVAAVIDNYVLSGRHHLPIASWLRACDRC